MLRNWEQLFQGGTIHEAEYMFITKGGQVMWALANWGPILEEASGQMGVQGSEQEITGR